MFFQWNYSKHFTWLMFAVVLHTSFNLAYANDEKPIFAPKIRLNDGNLIPVLGLGTSKESESVMEQAVKDAIDIGYRHIDTAFIYGTEKSVGNAIRAKIAEGVIKREDMFVTTKLWCTFHEPNEVAKAFQKSLDNLNISYVDLFLMHAPFAYQRISKTTNSTPTDFEDTNLMPFDSNNKRLLLDIDYLDTWKAMEALIETGKVRSLGVSNFNSQQLDRLVSSSKIKPVVNQVECHPNLNQRKLIEFSKARNVTVVAFSPLGRPSDAGNRNIAFKHPKVLEIAQKHNKNPGQIILRFSYQNGAVIIPKSTNKARLRGNIDIFDFSLDADDMATLNSLNDNKIRIIQWNAEQESKYYPFNIEF